MSAGGKQCDQEILACCRQSMQHWRATPECPAAGFQTDCRDVNELHERFAVITVLQSAPIGVIAKIRASIAG
jgi:hypothetical protein